MPDGVDALLFHLRAAGLPEPVREYRFHPVRKWRLDAAWVDRRIALECEGGYAVGGRHTSVAGFLGDMEKYNELAIAGWRLIRVTPRMVDDGRALATIERVLSGRERAGGTGEGTE